MNYVSTRGGDKATSFESVIMAGLAADGGLFVPTEFPKFSPEKIASFKGLSYPDLAFEVIFPFAADSISAADLQKILHEVYNEKKFRAGGIAPLKKLRENEYLLELFHGETLAFKDFALQLLGRFFDYFLTRSGKKINILGATSGDTGSAAIAGCAGSKNVNIFILHPHGRTSEVQRRQMTTIHAPNVFNIAVEGSFDDCQNIVKACFEDAELKQKYSLSAVNSINFGRILAQIVYYFYAAAQLEKPASYAVPTGNFGDILAGYYAHKMGLQVDKLIIATNKNDILHRFMQSGEYKMSGVEQTISPSMDIQISSNFERLLHDYHNHDGELIASKIKQLKQEANFRVEDSTLAEIKKLFLSSRADDGATLQTMSQVYQELGEVIDPHTATGIHAAREHKLNSPIVVLATAHAAKFPDAVFKATGVRPKLPDYLADLFDRKEKYSVTKANNTAIIEKIRSVNEQKSPTIA